MRSETGEMCVRWNVERVLRAVAVSWSFLNTGETVSVAVIPCIPSSIEKRCRPEPRFETNGDPAWQGLVRPAPETIMTGKKQ